MNKTIWLIRIGLAIVFIYFGADKLIHPEFWIGWIPQWLEVVLPVSLTTFVLINGVLEIILGVLLLIEKTVKPAAIAISLFLLSIIIQFGFNEIIVRDIGLLFMALALVVRKK